MPPFPATGGEYDWDPDKWEFVRRNLPAALGCDAHLAAAATVETSIPSPSAEG